MSEMSKILKCKLCGSQEYKDHVVDGTEQRLVLSEINFDMGFITQILMNDQYSIEVEVRDRRDRLPLCVKHIPITHCPFCGRELD